MLDGWTQLEKEPIQIGKCSRGFIIPKDKLSLKSNKKYIIRIKEKIKLSETEEEQLKEMDEELTKLNEDFTNNMG